MILNILVIILAFVSNISAEEILNSESEIQQNTQVKFERYMSEKGGISLVFPSNWQIMKGKMGTDLIALAPSYDPEDLFRENINIIYAKMDLPITPEQYYNYNIQSLEQLLNDFDLEKSEFITLGDVPAKKIIFTHTMGVLSTKVMQYLVIKDSHAYVITFTADSIDFEKILPLFTEIGSSLQIGVITDG